MSETKSLDNLRETPSLREIGQMTARAAGGTVEHFFQSNKKALADLVADTMRPERLLKIAQGAIRQNPDLQQCTVRSLFGAVVVCASMGLEPNTHEGLCWFIPRKISRPRKNERGVIMTGQDGKWLWDTTYEVNVQIGYKGRIALAYRNPQVKLVRTSVIHANDKYRIVEGTNPRIDHEPHTKGDPGEPIIYYAIAKLATGETLFDWMARSDVERIRDDFSDAYRRANTLRMEAQNILARGGNAEVLRKAQAQLDRAEDAPWIRDFDQMARKTLINRISNYLPANRQSALAAALDVRETTLQSQDLEQYTYIDADFDSESSEAQADEEASQELQQLSHQQPGPTVDGLKGKQRETAAAQGEPQQTKTESQPKQEVRTESKAESRPATDLAGRPTPWFEAPEVRLSTRALTAAKKGAEYGATTLQEALAKDRAWWIALPGVGEAAQAQLEVVLNGLRPAAPQAAQQPAEPNPAPTQGPADVHEEDAGGFGDAA